MSIVRKEIKLNFSGILKLGEVKNILYDPSVWTLFLVNLLTIFLAVAENWNIVTIMWVYWFQSIVIGFFNIVRVLTIKDSSAQNIHLNGIETKPKKPIKIILATFFSFHYGIFHLIYALFLIPLLLSNNSSEVSKQTKYILLTCFIFFLNHLFSYVYNRKKDRLNENIGKLMIFPYARIIPMQCTLVFGTLLGSGMLTFFLFLKTIADIIMHIIQHSEIKSVEINTSGI